MFQGLRKSVFKKFPLHSAIDHSNYHLLVILTSSSETDINQQNNAGETPLLFCLKLRRPDHFIVHLINRKCNVTIPDQDGITPLSIALKDVRLDIASHLISAGADIDSDLDVIYPYIQRAIEDENWGFMLFLIRHYKDVVLFFLLTLSSKRCDLNNDFILFLKLTRLDSYLSRNCHRKKYNFVGINLFEYCMRMSAPAIFKLIWPWIDHCSMSNCEPAILKIYFDFCNFERTEFVDCLNVILASPHASNFFKFYKNQNICHNFFEDLLKMCLDKDIAVQDKVLLMSVSFGYIDVTIFDLIFLYDSYGLTRDVLFLTTLFNRKNLMDNESHHPFALQFLNSLLDDSSLESDVLGTLKFMAKMGYSLMKNWFDKTLFENICSRQVSEKKEVLSLFELSSSIAQKRIQSFCQSKNPAEFEHAVESLLLPRFIKKRLCYKIPICYENSKSCV